MLSAKRVTEGSIALSKATFSQSQRREIAIDSPSTTRNVPMGSAPASQAG
jgi:hypothetical protein